MEETQRVTASQAHAFLAGYLDTEPCAVQLIGEGAWSRCFGFRRGDEELVIRFGNYVDDFRKDEIAAAYATPALPVPAVLAVGQAFAGYFAISRRAYGARWSPLARRNGLPPCPFESSLPWKRCVRRICLRLRVSGGWGADGRAQHATWSSHLLAVGADTPQQHTPQFRHKRLATSPVGDTHFYLGLSVAQADGKRLDSTLPGALQSDESQRPGPRRQEDFSSVRLGLLAVR